jgi:ASC-1-like (ASCH) protein
MDIRVEVSEPWYSLIASAAKTIEGRKNKGLFKDLKVGDLVYILSPAGHHCVVRVVAKRTYSTFQEYLEHEGLRHCLPTIETISDGVAVYRQWYSAEDEAAYGVVAIEMKLLE